MTCAYNCFSGVLVPGGFGTRGVEGKILAAEWARKTKKPFLGKFYYSIKHFQHYILNVDGAVIGGTCMLCSLYPHSRIFMLVLELACLFFIRD